MVGKGCKVVGEEAHQDRNTPEEAGTIELLEVRSLEVRQVGVG